MTVAERALKVKYNLWLKHGVKRGRITPEILRDAIYATGLSKKSRGIKAVIYYLMDYRHLGRSGNYYYVIYKRKEKANPKHVTLKTERNLGYDIEHQLSSHESRDSKNIFPLLMLILIEDLKMIERNLKQKGSCIIKFSRKG